MKEKSYFVYILANQTNTVTYVGVTSDLIRRVWEHKNKVVVGFTSKYNVDKLVYYEQFGEARLAIEREKEIKGWCRSKKVTLIRSNNSDWHELYASIL